jgi:O-antigen ligase
MQGQIDSRPWFGHGANASEPFVLRLTGAMTHPHNDWLRLLYDYGHVGTVTFAFCMLWQMVHLLRTGMKTAGMTRILFYAGASSFLVFSLFMSTDNIILYAAYFGNLQFAIIGLAYATNSAQAPSAGRPLWARIKW